MSRGLGDVYKRQDCIVDLVQTGKTLKENGLNEIEIISEISSRLIVNKSSFKVKFERINQIEKKLKEIQ